MIILKKLIALIDSSGVLDLIKIYRIEAGNFGSDNVVMTINDPWIQIEYDGNWYYSMFFTKDDVFENKQIQFDPNDGLPLPIINALKQSHDQKIN